MNLPPSHEEWLALIPIGGYPVHDLEVGGHLIVVSQPGLIQARCKCDWAGPDRTEDPHAEELVIDDTSWHCHEVGTKPCPDRRCLTCHEEPA